jgi:3-phosphoshikimate 1-carboxyvinyltransferase
MKITLSSGPALLGEVTLPGDKSLSHRAALFAALAEGTSRIDHFLVSGVTRPLLDALTSLGIRWELDNSRLTVWGEGWQHMNPPAQTIFCGNSATTLRLLAGAVAAAGVSAVLDGSPGLRSRPMARITQPLRAMGVEIDAAAQECAPLVIQARAMQRLRSIEYHLPVASAQVKSCLLLAALSADGPVTLHEPGPSRDHTERMLASMGVEIACQEHTVRLVPPDKPLRPITFTPPGDFSSAAFLIVAALITPGSKVILREVGLNPTRTGLLDALLSMGAEIQIENVCDRAGERVGDLIVRHSQLTGTQVSGETVVRMIDEFPVFSIAAAFAKGKTQVCDAVELRYKESDRIAVLCQELRGIGINVVEAPDGFTIDHSEPVRGGSVHAHGDHRIAMSLALAGLASTQPVIVHQAEMIFESFPEFTSALSHLGANILQEED